ncbi:hypothetical protein JZ751_020968 [Albula glossodonta]|uniref:Ig-like domain-containing protein n=1 Tax=Albula glossodonta TaxID=121402 RepID=A0A8T2PJ38_9TELE|nr:hypothetical protein JZ751_020968 [Albula glossodonta]
MNCDHFCLPEEKTMSFHAFCSISMRLRPVVVLILCLLVLQSVSLPSSSPLVVKGTFGAHIHLPCDGSAYRGIPDDSVNVLWETAKGERVVFFSNGVYGVGLHFDERVSFLPKGTGQGDFSLNISYLVYSDEGRYRCVWSKGHDDEKSLSDVQLQVSAPYISKELTVSAGNPVTLPCYDHVNKQMQDSKLFIQWRRGDKLVLRLSAGEFTYGKEYTERASMSLERIRQGDFSLSLSITGVSDKGEYQCSTHNNTIFTSVNLTLKDHHPLFSLETGMTLHLSLPRPPVKVYLSQNGRNEPVCLVPSDHAICYGKYNDGRVKFKDSTLSIAIVDSNAEGRYIVLEANNNFTIKEITLRVTSGPSEGFYVFVIFLSFGLLLLVRKKLHFGPKEMLHIISSVCAPVCSKRIKS